MYSRSPLRTTPRPTTLYAGLSRFSRWWGESIISVDVHRRRRNRAPHFRQTVPATGCWLSPIVVAERARRETDEKAVPPRPWPQHERVLPGKVRHPESREARQLEHAIDWLTPVAVAPHQNQHCEKGCRQRLRPPVSESRAAPLCPRRPCSPRKQPSIERTAEPGRRP